MLLVATLAGSNVLPLHVALPLVLGANLGSGIAGVADDLKVRRRHAPRAARQFRVQGRRRDAGASPAAVRHAVADAAARSIRATWSWSLPPRLQHAAGLDVHPVHRPRRPTHRTLAAGWPRQRKPPAQPRYLDPVALATPPLALGNAAREAIRLADTVQDMLTGLLTVLRTNDSAAGRGAAPARRRDRSPVLRDQALPGADQPRGARCRRIAALDRDHPVHDQHGARRRHHRARTARRCRTQDPARPVVLRRRHHRDHRPARAAGRQPPAGSRGVPQRRPEIRAVADVGKGRLPRTRNALRRPAPACDCPTTRASRSRPVRCTSICWRTSSASIHCSARSPTRSSNRPACCPRRGARRAAGGLFNTNETRDAPEWPLSSTDIERAVRDQGRPHVRGRACHPAAACAAVGGTR